MKINYNRLVELNKEALVDQEKAQLQSFYIIQISIEKYVNGETITEQAKNLLIQLGVLVQDEEDIAREQIVGPFNFSQRGTQNT